MGSDEESAQGRVQQPSPVGVQTSDSPASAQARAAHQDAGNLSAGDRLQQRTDSPEVPTTAIKTPTSVTTGAPHTATGSNSSAAHGATPSFAPWAQAFALDLLDKQYRLYSWSDAKALSLITTNSLLLAAIGFLFKECLQDVLATLLISVGLVLAALSLFYSLIQVIPQGSSGKGGSKANLRALSGILSFPDWQAYVQAFHGYSLDSAISDTLRQAYGMAHNTDLGRKSITLGVKLTIASLLFVVLSAFSVAGAAGGYNLLGKWQRSTDKEKEKDKEVSVSAQSVTASGIAAAVSSPKSTAAPSGAAAQAVREASSSASAAMPRAASTANSLQR